MSTLQEQAEALLETVDAAEGEKKHERLTPADRALIFQLAAREVEQADIARIVGCHQSTVSRALKFIDTREGARAIFNSKAADMAEHVIDKGDPETHRKVLTQMDVLPDKGSGGNPAVVVMVGIQASDEERRGLLPDIVVAQIANGPGVRNDDPPR